MLIIRVDQEAPDNLIHRVKTGDEYHMPGIQPGEFVVSEENINKIKQFIVSLKDEDSQLAA